MMRSNYKIEKIGDICKLNVGGDRPKNFSPTKTKECNVPVFSNGNENKGLYGYTDKAKVLKKCITLSARGNVGTVFYREEPFTPIVRLISIFPDENKIDIKYLYYLLNVYKIGGYGTSQQQITTPWLKRVKIKYLEDTEYQKKIADILSNYDEAIENNNKRISILEQMADEIYKEWFIRFRFPGDKNAEFENGIPKGWKVKKVKECVKRMNFGTTYKAEELEREGNVIVIDQSKDEYLGFHNNEPSHKADLDNPIMLFGDHSCKTKIMIKDFSLGENVIPYISSDNDEINNYYLYYATKRLIETEEYKRHWSRFCGFKILIPPIVLQNKFMQYIKMMEQEKELLWQENQNLIKQRDLLLPRLMSGKLEVK